MSRKDDSIDLQLQVLIYFFSGDFRLRRDDNWLLVQYKAKQEIYFLSLIHGIKIEF